MTYKLNKIFFSIALILLITTASIAQQVLELDGENIVLNPSSSVVFDAVTGTITANSLDGSLVCSHDGVGSGSGNVPVITGFSATNVVFGGVPQLSWTISNSATSCVKSEGWSGRSFAKDGNGVIVNSTGTSTGAPITSSRSYSMHCSNCSGASLIVKTTANIINNDPPVVTLTVNGSTNSTTIEDNMAAALVWTISNADNITCNKTGFWSGTTGTIIANGSGNTGLLTSNGSPYTFGLECYNNGNSGNTSGLQSVIVNVGSGLPSSCFNDLDPVNPANLQRDTRLLYYISDATLGSLQANGITPGFEHQEWPADHSTIQLGITRNRYISLKFETDSTLIPASSIVFANPPLGVGPPSQGTTFSISECPGDFRQSLGKCLKTASNTNSLFWTTGAATNLACNLDKNKEYYLNIIHSDDSYSFDFSSCPSNETHCGIQFFNAD